jgi:hypothetical protein
LRKANREKNKHHHGTKYWTTPLNIPAGNKREEAKKLKTQLKTKKMDGGTISKLLNFY